MDKNLQKDFIVHKGLALSAFVDVSNCNPAKITSPAAVQDYVIQLAKLLQAERVDDCVIKSLGKGTEEIMTFIQILDRGLISGHICVPQLCIFTDVMLHRVFDPADVTNFTQQFFDGGKKSTARKIRS
jgi:hypothetical protein